MKSVTVVGSGANGLTTAAYLTLQGYAVTLCDTREQLDEVAQINEKGIVLHGAVGKEGEQVHPACISDDIAGAVAEADYILVCVSVERHQAVCETIAPRIRDGQTILFNPGNMGAVRLSRLRPELPEMPDVCMAELSGCFWACRLTEDNGVTVALPVGPKHLAAYPSGKTALACERVGCLFPVKPATNVIEAALNSPNVITHLAGTIYNVAQIEQQGENFAFFLHGMSETVIQTFVKLEKERNAVLRAAGLEVYEETSEGFMRKLMDKSVAPELNGFRALKGPSSMKHRYMVEDALCGVTLLVSVAKHYGIPVPLTESFLTIASAINDRPYYLEGDTVEKLGLLSSDDD